MALAPDPVLPHRDAALDPAATAAALAPHLAGMEGCRPRYVRYRPGRRLLVLYDIDLGGAGTLAHLTMLPPRRAARLWGRIEAAGLAEHARRVPELGGVAQLFPADVRLPALADAVARGPAELVRYKPGRRAVLRYDGARVVYGKLRADTAGALHVELSRRLIELGISTPAPLGYLPDLQMTLHEEQHGTRLAELRGPDLEAWMEPVAAALARLHATNGAELPTHSMQDEIEDLRAAADTAAALLPHRRADVDALLDHLVAGLAAARPAAATIHGSFHDDQVLVGDEGVSLLDLDSAAVGGPLLDVGHFASYLSAAGETAARERFLDAWSAPPAVLLYEAAALLRWSSLPFRDLEPGWPAAVERRIDLALERAGASAPGLCSSDGSGGEARRD
jgi:hypothetical protein